MYFGTYLIKQEQRLKLKQQTQLAKSKTRPPTEDTAEKRTSKSRTGASSGGKSSKHSIAIKTISRIDSDPLSKLSRLQGIGSKHSVDSSKIISNATTRFHKSIPKSDSKIKSGAACRQKRKHHVKLLEDPDQTYFETSGKTFYALSENVTSLFT